MSLTLLHFSDIHFNQHHLDRWDPDEDLRREVVHDLRRVTAETGPADAVLITGDIAFSGQQSEYAALRGWLGEVAELACHDSAVVLMVPGNHDVDRTVAASSRVIQLAQERIRQTPDEGLDRELEEALRDRETGPTLLAPLEAYNAFAATFGCAITPNCPWWERQFALGHGYVLRMRGATSVLVSDHLDNDNNRRLAVPTQMVMLPQEPHTVAMLLAHHPREWTRRRDEIGDILDARARIQLYGHRHVFRPRVEVGNLIVHAGATHPERGNEWWPHYNVLQLDIVPEADSIALRAYVYPRKWYPREMRFGVDTDPDGVARRAFNLPLGDRTPPEPGAPPPVTLGPGTGSRADTVTPPPQPTSPAQDSVEGVHEETPAMEGAPATPVTGHAQTSHSYRDPKSSTAPVDASEHQDDTRNTQNDFGKKTVDTNADTDLQVPPVLRLVDRPFGGQRRATVSGRPDGRRSQAVHASGPTPKYSGQIKIEVCQRLYADWKDLADYFGVKDYERRTFDRGREPQGLWEWLERRGRLDELGEGLAQIGRSDLLPLLEVVPFPPFRADESGPHPGR
jgi:hypothetical protein